MNRTEKGRDRSWYVSYPLARLFVSRRSFLPSNTSSDTCHSFRIPNTSFQPHLYLISAQSSFQKHPFFISQLLFPHPSLDIFFKLLASHINPSLSIARFASSAVQITAESVLRFLKNAESPPTRNLHLSSLSHLSLARFHLYTLLLSSSNSILLSIATLAFSASPFTTSTNLAQFVFRQDSFRFHCSLSILLYFPYSNRSKVRDMDRIRRGETFPTPESPLFLLLPFPHLHLISASSRLPLSHISTSDSYSYPSPFRSS